MATRRLVTTTILFLAWALPSVADLVPNLWFNITLNPSSGIVQDQNGNMFYEGTSWDFIGKGDVSNQWALALEFFGRDLYLYGDIQNGGDDPLDGSFNNGANPSNAMEGLLGSSSGLFLKYSSLSFNNHLLGEFRPTRDDVDMRLRTVTITTGMVTQAPAFEDVVRHTDYFVVDNALNPNMTLTADQGVSVDIVQQQQSATDATIYTILRGNATLAPNPVANGASDDSAVAIAGLRVGLPVPSNTSFFILNGTVTANSRGGYIAATPQPNFWLLDRFNQTTGDGSYAHDLWYSSRKNQAVNPSDEIANEVLFFAPLDPSVEYNLTIHALGHDIGLHSITYFSNNYLPPNIASSPTSDTPSSTQEANEHRQAISKAPVIGGVVGGVLGGALLVGLLWFAVSRYRRQRRKSLMDGGLEFEIDHSAEPPMPFQDDDSATQLMGALAIPMDEIKRGGGKHVSKTTSAYGLYRPTSSATGTTYTEHALLSTTPGVEVGSPRGPSPPPIVIAERDAGGVQRYEYVPPQYDPLWAAGHETPLSD